MITDADSTTRAQTAHGRGMRSLTALAAVAVVGLIAAACGSSSPSTSPTTIAPSSAGGTKPAAAKTVVNALSNTTLGSTILVTTTGKTLYTLSADTGGMSTCTGACAAAWPPLTIPAGDTPKGGTGTSGTFSTITRADGSLQVTDNGQPLYTFSGDSSAGSTSGNGVKDSFGTWSVVKLGAAASTGTTSPAATKTPTTMATTPAPTTTAPSGGGYGY